MLDAYIGNRPITEATGYTQEWTPTDGQTTFLITYLPGYLDVYVNGLRLQAADFTATSGTSFTLHTPVTSADAVAAYARARQEDFSNNEVLAAKAGRKNLLINGGFDVWQRGNGPYQAQGYTADRWHSPSANQAVFKDARLITAPGEGSFPNILGLQLMSGTAPVYISQAIELPIVGLGLPYQGRKVTASFLVYAEVAVETFVQLGFSTGVAAGDYTIIETIKSASYINTGNWQKFSFTFDIQVPPHANNNCLLFEVGFDNPGLGHDYYLSEVQLEFGDRATDFEYRPIGEELALCQRYYEKGNQHLFYIAGGSSIGHYTHDFKVTKRVNPAVAINGWTYYSGGTPTPYTPTINPNTRFFHALGTGLTNYYGQAGTGTWTADAEL